MATDNIYVSKENLTQFTIALKVKLDNTYAKMHHMHSLAEIQPEALASLIQKSELFAHGFSDPTQTPKFEGQMYINGANKNLFIANGVGNVSDYVQYLSKESIDKLLNDKANSKHMHSIKDLEFVENVDYLDYRMLPRGTASLPGILQIGNGALDAAPGNHSHPLASELMDGLMSKEFFAKLNKLEAYVHPDSEGYKHVPANGSSKGGMVLTAGTQPGVFNWAPLPVVNIDQNGLMPSEMFVQLSDHIVSNESVRHKTVKEQKILDTIGSEVTAQNQIANLSTEHKDTLVGAVNEVHSLSTKNATDITDLQSSVAGLSGTKTAIDAMAFNSLNPINLKEGTICYVLDTTGLVVDGKAYEGQPTSFIVIDPDLTGSKPKQWKELSAMTPTMEAGNITYNNASMPGISSVNGALDNLQENKLGKANLVANKIVIVGNNPESPDALQCSEIEASKLDYLADVVMPIGAALDTKSTVGHSHSVADLSDLAAMDEYEIANAIEQAFTQIAGV